MSLVKLKTAKGIEVYANSDHVALVSPLTTVGQSAITLPSGLSIEFEGTARENALRLGFQDSLEI